MAQIFSFFPGGLDPELEIAFKPLCLELSAEQVVELAERVRAHLETLRQVATVNKALDKATRLGASAAVIARRLVGLLGEMDSLPKEQGRLLVSASRYFTRSMDIQPDFNSQVGFEDDARVLNFVMGQIGREDLKLEGRSI
jgi:uncharacterized membrane protein YkvA (DUF1232 family)